MPQSAGLSKKYTFKPKLIPTLGFLIVLPILLMLGNWQWHRASQKQQMLDSIQQRKQHKPLLIDKVPANIQQAMYYPLILDGEYLNQYTILLDNRIHEHAAGYDVYTPFLPKDKNKAILVNRGWVSMGETRNNLPTIQPLDGNTKVLGTIASPSNGFVLTPSELKIDKKPILVQKIDLNQLAELIKQPLEEYILILNSHQPGSLIYNWNPVIMPPAKHVAYSVQWYGLALTLLIIYIALNLKRLNDDR